MGFDWIMECALPGCGSNVGISVILKKTDAAQYLKSAASVQADTMPRNAFVM